MRVSLIKDADWNTADIATYQYNVYFNDQHVMYCIEANEEEGYIVLALPVVKAETTEGHFLVNEEGNPIYIRLDGKVQLRAFNKDGSPLILAP